MWVYVVMNFSERTKIGRQAKNEFYRILEKDGFQMISKNIYVRYCSTQNSALSHKENIREKIFEKYPISIILVADKQNEYSYHYFGRRKCNKNQENSLKMPEMVEFF